MINDLKFTLLNYRKSDFENYLATLLIRDRDLKRWAFAVRAFNVEVAQVRDATSNVMIARMRFQFWSDIVDDIFGERKSERIYVNQPVAAELYQVNDS